eukprot:Gb_20899 [translate_table: standard]
MIFLQLVLELSVEDLGELVYAWELPGVAGNAWNGEPGRSIAIGSSCIWDKFIFLATGRPGDCMEMLLECLRNPGRRLGIVTGLQLVCGRWSTYVEATSVMQSLRQPWAFMADLCGAVVDCSLGRGDSICGDEAEANGSIRIESTKMRTVARRAKHFKIIF